MGFVESIEGLLTGALGPFGPVIAVGVLGIFMILLTIPMMLQQQKDPLDKLREASKGRTVADAQGKKQALRTAGGKQDKLAKYSNFLEPQDEEEYSTIRLKLLQAGYRSKNAVRTYHFLQFALGLGLLILGAIYAVIKSSTGEPSTSALVSGPGRCR